MIGIYFSGTGNTKYCVERFASLADANAKSLSIEDKTVISELSAQETIIFGFPIYYSNIPKIAKDFITKNKDVFANKKVYIITTKGLFNAFGVGYAVRLFKDCGAEFIGSSQFNMPDNIRDMLIMEIAFGKNYKKTIEKADKKIANATAKFKSGKLQKSGLNPLNYIIGFFLNILWFYPKTDKYINAPKINADKCSGCGKCVKLCPMSNIKIVDGKAFSADKCTICYRCFNNCPAKALTILGRKVYDQYTFENNT